jgi:alkylhydroperoxidase/carboxymuconolactone decarboxylase family protein YurZ
MREVAAPYRVDVMPVDLPASDELDGVPAQLLATVRDLRRSIEESFSVDLRDASFARLGALMALGATPGSIRGHIRHLESEGVTREEIWSVIYSIIGHVGMPRFVSMLPALRAELGPDPRGAAR